MNEAAFIAALRSSMDVPHPQAVIERALKFGIILRTVRRFQRMKPLSLISLNLKVLTYQSLQWVILSLRNDEMTPSEKGLQSRIKEAFGLKLEP
jgi:hypothetical protein